MTKSLSNMANANNIHFSIITKQTYGRRKLGHRGLIEDATVSAMPRKGGTCLMFHWDRRQHQQQERGSRSEADLRFSVYHV